MRIAICDDETSQREKYSALLAAYAEKHHVEMQLRQYSGGDQLLFHMEDAQSAADILFLDIHMPGMSGSETAAKLRGMGYAGEIVFLTVSEEYMLSAFDVAARHYIVKDKTPPEKIEEIFLNAVACAEEKQTEYLLLSSVGEYRHVPIRKIQYFEVMQRLITVYYNENDRFEFVSTIGKLETALYGKGFIRISKSFLVAADAVSGFTYENLTLTTGQVLPVGRKYYKPLKDELARLSGV